MCVCKICTSISCIFLGEIYLYKYHSPNYIVFMVLRNKILLLNNLRKVLRTYMSNMCVHKNLCALEYIAVLRHIKSSGKTQYTGRKRPKRTLPLGCLASYGPARIQERRKQGSIPKGGTSYGLPCPCGMDTRLVLVCGTLLSTLSSLAQWQWGQH